MQFRPSMMLRYGLLITYLPMEMGVVIFWVPDDVLRHPPVCELALLLLAFFSGGRALWLPYGQLANPHAF